MNSIFLKKSEIPAKWLEEIKNSIGEDIVFSPRGGEFHGEIIPDTLYSFSMDEYLNYLRNGGIWSYYTPEELAELLKN